MKWFDNWFMSKVRWANSVPHEHEIMADIVTSNRVSAKTQRGLISKNDSELDSRGVTFNLHSANGGHVVELRNYDERTDRMKNSLHLIPHDKDLGEALNHIITYEALKR